MTTGRSLLTFLAAAVLCARTPLPAAESLPFKLFDTHVHFLSPDFDRYPLRIPAAPPGAAANAATANLADRIQKNPTNAERILSLWDANGVEGGVGVQYRTAYGTDNTYLLDSAATYRKRVTAIALLDPVDPNTPYILRSMVRDAGAAGVRFSAADNPKTADYAWLNSEAAMKSWAAANDVGAVVVLMALPPTSFDARRLEIMAENARKFPNVRVVLDHFGWVSGEGAPNYGITPTHAALKAQKNIFFKFSSLNLESMAKAKTPGADFVRHAVDVFGADRIMWGSDLGNTQVSYEEMVAEAIAATAKLTPAERKNVLHDTGKAVHVRGGIKR